MKNFNFGLIQQKIINVLTFYCRWWARKSNDTTSPLTETKGIIVQNTLLKFKFQVRISANDFIINDELQILAKQYIVYDDVKESRALQSKL